MRDFIDKYLIYSVLFSLVFNLCNYCEGSFVTVEGPSSPVAPQNSKYVKNQLPLRLTSALNQAKHHSNLNNNSKLTSTLTNNNNLTSKPQLPKLDQNALDTRKDITSNNKKSLIDRSNHEIQSQSSLSSFYNYINGQNRNLSGLYGSSMGAGSGIALGKETEIQQSSYKQPHGQESVPADFILTPPGGMNPFAELPSQLYGQEIMIQNGPSQQQEQVLASFYANGYPNSPPQQQQQQQQMISSNNMGDVPQVYAGSTSAGAMYNQHQSYHPQPTKNDKRIFGSHKQMSKMEKSPTNNKNNLLSNDQLASLIDELKDFNSRQASRIQSNILPDHPVRKESKGETTNSNDDDDDDDVVSESDNLDVSATKNESNNENQNKKDDGAKINADDLSKFAKFLMTKEGSNLKFQLGLEKESPDDGDEEEHDALLESKKKTTRRKKPIKTAKSELDDLDRKHTDVENQMERLIADVSQSLKNSEAKRRKRKRKNKQPEVVVGDRKRRDHSSSMQNSKSVRNETEKLDRKPGTENEQHENFAKMLIQKELLNDKQEAGSEDSREDKMKKSSKKKKKKRKSRESDGLIVHKNGVLMQPSSYVNKVMDNQQNTIGNSYVYSKPERDGDQKDLIGELEKSRDKKARLRDRLPIASHSPAILKRALNGDLGIQSQMNPDGTLILKANKDGVLKLKLPKKKHDQNQGVDSLKSDVLESSQTGENQVESVKLQSPTPLEDEYPVSERVSDRLNKLSNNIDRLFKDGFLREIESKSRIKGSNSSPDEAKNDHHEQSSSNINETPVNKVVKEAKVDHDFDVNVSIDGKRDPDPDPDEEADPEADEKDETEDGDDAKKIQPRKKIESHVSHGKGSAKKTSPAADKSRPTDNENTSSHLRRDETSRNEKIEFENTGALLPLDPVDSEDMNTPIGPDTDEADGSLTSATGSKRTEESKVRARYGKKLGGQKFYEEPQWR